MAMAPAGCRRDLNWIYYSLCNLKEGWGILVEALAALGLVLGVGLTAASLVAAAVRSRQGWRRDHHRWPLLALRMITAAGCLGVLALTFAFVVKPHADNCSARRFLFGTLSAFCFAGLGTQAGRLVWPLSPGAPWVLAGLLLVLVQCLLAIVWLVTSTVRAQPLELVVGQNPCSVAKGDFVGALVYPMVLLALALCLSLAGLLSPGARGRTRKRAACLVGASGLSVGVWVACLAAYLRGERRPTWARASRNAWDDSPLAALLLAQGWVLLGCCLLPWAVEAWRKGGEDDEEEDERSLGVSSDNGAYQPEGVAGKLKSPFEDMKPPVVLKLESKSPDRSSITPNPQYRTHFL